MQGHQVDPQLVDVTELIDDVKKAVPVMADHKSIDIHITAEKPVYIYAEQGDDQSCVT